MAGTFSFDVVSEYERQELVNAIDQATREIRTRYDLKDTKSDIKLEEERLVLTGDSEYQLGVIKDLIETKALRRNLSLKIFDWGTPEEATGGTYRQIVTLRKGIAEDIARRLRLCREQCFGALMQPRAKNGVSQVSLRLGETLDAERA